LAEVLSSLLTASGTTVAGEFPAAAMPFPAASGTASRCGAGGFPLRRGRLPAGSADTHLVNPDVLLFGSRCHTCAEEVAVLGPGAAAELAGAAARLLNGADASGTGSLHQIAFLAARQVPGCSGAAAVLWRDGDPAEITATHPDLSELFEVSWRDRADPWQQALTSGEAVYCADTLAEDRWPAYAAEASCRGVRCSVTLARSSGTAAMTLSLFGAKPGRLDPEQAGLADLLAAFGVAAGNAAPAGGDHRDGPAVPATERS
jgi:hypothetical protein